MADSQGLTRTTKLRCSESLVISIEGDEATLRVDGVRVYSGPKTLLGILSAFTTPRSLDEGLALAANFGGRLRHDAIERSATVVGLVKAGVLQVAEGPPLPRVAPTNKGFAAAPIHIAMLNDWPRTQTYLEALRSQVQPGDVVVDVGTGTGILAATAAKCGARHVYAIEVTGIASVASAMFEANGLTDKITLIEGRSSAVELPERADLMVSELIGDDPLGERALAYTRDAMARFVKPGGRLLPRSVRAMAQAVKVPTDKLAQQLFTKEVTARWTERYGLDLSPLAEARRVRPHAAGYKPDVIAEWISLSDPIEILSIDFQNPADEVVDTTRQGRATRAGWLDGVVVWFDLVLADGYTITSRPGQARPECHWHCPVWLLTQPFEVTEKSCFELSYRHTPIATTLDCRQL